MADVKLSAETAKQLAESAWKQNGGGTFTCNGCTPWSWSFKKEHLRGCPFLTLEKALAALAKEGT
jgi:hypothetical protein